MDTWREERIRREVNRFVSTRLESEENSKTSCNVRNFGEENSKGELNKRREMRCVGISNERERERERSNRDISR